MIDVMARRMLIVYRSGRIGRLRIIRKRLKIIENGNGCYLRRVKALILWQNTRSKIVYVNKKTMKKLEKIVTFNAKHVRLLASYL